MSAKSGTFNTYVSALKNGKQDEFPPLVSYEAGAMLALTAEGRAAAESTVSINSITDLHDAWKKQVKNSTQRLMLEIIIANHPRPVSRQVVADTLDMSSSSGTFNTYISGLKSLGIIKYGPDKTLLATDLLFPEGL